MKKAILSILFFAALLSAAAIKQVTPTGTDGTASGGSGAVSWADDQCITFDTAFFYAAPGDTFYWKGDHTIASVLTDTAAAKDGTGAAPVTWINVKAATTNVGASIVKSDWALDSADMGLVTFTSGGYFYCGTNNRWEYGRFTGDGNYLFRMETDGVIMETYQENTNGGAAYYCINIGTNGIVSHNTLRGANTHGVLGGDGTRVCFNNFIGFSNASYGQAIRCNGRVISGSNTFYNCRYAIYLNGNNGVTDLGSTAYGCAYFAFSTGSERLAYFVNTLPDSCTVAGISWNTATNNNVFCRIHGDDTRNTDMWVNVADPGTLFGACDTTAGQPLFVNPPDSLQLQAGSPADSALTPR